MTCFPNGVQKLPYSCPVPFFADEIKYRLIISPRSFNNSSCWSVMLIVIFIITLSGFFAFLYKKLFEQCTCFISQDACSDLYMMVEPCLRWQINDATARTGFQIRCGIHQALDTCMKHGANAHGTGLQR